MPARRAVPTAFGKRCASFNLRESGTVCGVSKIRLWFEHLIRERIHLEVCPTSNLQTGITQEFAEHAVDELYRAGVPLSISTDTRTITNITLTEEYRNLEEHFGWTPADLAACNQAAIDAAFVEESAKSELRERIGAQPGYGFLHVKLAASSVLPLPL